MKSSIIILSTILLLLLTSSIFSNDKQQIIVKAIHDYSDSIVILKFECQYKDGDGVKDFEIAGLIINKKGIIMVPGVNDVDPPVGGYLKKPKEFTVIFNKNTKVKASLMAKSNELNLALFSLREDSLSKLKKKPNIKPISFSYVDGFKQAEEIIILSRLSEHIDYKPTFDLMRITAILDNPVGLPSYLVNGSLSGYAGCPIITMNGKVAGIVGREPSKPGGRYYKYQGRTYTYGYSSGSLKLICYKDFKDYLLDPSRYNVRKSWLGIRGMQPLSKILAEQLKIKEQGGIIIGEVLQDTPAQRAGLKSNDILIQLNDTKLDIKDEDEIDKFVEIIESTLAGSAIKMTILRKFDCKYKQVKLLVQLEREPTWEYEVIEKDEPIFKLKLKPLTRDFLDRERLPLDSKGVRVTDVESASWAFIAGVRQDDVIVSVNMKKTSNIDNFKKVINRIVQKKEVEVCFKIIRNGKSYFRCVRPHWDIKN